MSWNTDSSSGGGISAEEVQAIIATKTGWAQYEDDQYTQVSPLVVNSGVESNLSNNAANVIDFQLPVGVTSLYDPVTNKMTPAKSGDGYLLRIGFEAYSSSQNGYGEVHLDIGGTLGRILTIPITFKKGAGLSNSQSFVVTEFLYSLDTFIENGGLITFESIDGNSSIYDISFIFTRVHEGL